MISWKNENKMHTAEKPVIKIYVSRPDARKCELLLKGSITRSAMCLIHSATCIQLLKIKFRGFFSVKFFRFLSCVRKCKNVYNSNGFMGFVEINFKSFEKYLSSVLCSRDKKSIKFCYGARCNPTR